MRTETLIVNVVGSFLIGFVAAITGPDGRLLVSPVTRQFWMPGIFASLGTLEGSLVEIGGKAPGLHSSLMGSEQPALEEREGARRARARPRRGPRG